MEAAAAVPNFKMLDVSKNDDIILIIYIEI